MLTYHERTDFFTFPAGARAHGVNTRGVGGGLAADVFALLPEMETVYKFACNAGTLEPGDSLPYKADDGTWWYNVASQRDPGPDATVEWIISGLQKAVDHAQEQGVATMTIPCIGAGIGGLLWGDVRAALYDTFTDGLFHLQVVTRGRFSDYAS